MSLFKWRKDSIDRLLKQDNFCVCSRIIVWPFHFCSFFYLSCAEFFPSFSLSLSGSLSLHFKLTICHVWHSMNSNSHKILYISIVPFSVTVKSHTFRMNWLMSFQRNGHFVNSSTMFGSHTLVLGSFLLTVKAI